MASVALFTKVLGEEYYAEIVVFSFGLYMAGNVGEYWAKHEKRKKENDNESTK